MYGSRSREMNRIAFRQKERTASNAADRISIVISEHCRKRALIPDMKKEKDEIINQMKSCKGPGGIRMYRMLSAKAKSLEQQIESIERGDEARSFFERARPLLTDKVDEDFNVEQQKEMLAMALFHPNKAARIHLRMNECSKCSADLVINNEESLLICPECHLTYPYLQLSTDHVDANHIAQDTSVNHRRSTSTKNVDNTVAEETGGFPRPALYRKHLYQFSKRVEPPKPAVLEIILQELSKVHIQSNTKAQPTPVSNILKAKGLQEWCWMATRIAIMLRKKPHEPEVLFDDQLIDKLVRRYELLLESMKKARQQKNKNVWNFRYLTKNFLTMEGEHELAELFDNHKTRNVLRREDKRVATGCAIMRQDPKQSDVRWLFKRSL